MIKTADLCDAHPTVQIVDPIFASFGRRRCFSGPMETVKVYEDNVLVRQRLETAGEGKVLVVDGGGSRRCALMGDKLAGFAVANGWAGVVIWGYIRDSAEIEAMDIGVRALGTMPRKSRKGGVGEVGVPLQFAGVRFTPGEYLYADEDGIILSERLLDGESS